MAMPKPKTESRYLKAPKPGQAITVRFMTDPVEFYEAWKDKKPVRRPATLEGSTFPAGSYDAEDAQGRPQKPRYSMAFGVMHQGAAMVFQIKQRTILDPLYALESNKKWGPLPGYDVVITAADDGKSYTVTPDPKAPLDENDALVWKATLKAEFNLAALLTNEDPFGYGASSRDPILDPDFDADNPIPF